MRPAATAPGAVAETDWRVAVLAQVCQLALDNGLGLVELVDRRDHGKHDAQLALRCGIGNSMRALRAPIGRFGRLLTDTGPDDVVRGLRSAPSAATASIAGFHLFPFGGLRKAGDWLHGYDRDPLGCERAAISGAGLQNP